MTVSRVVSGAPHVQDATRVRVQAVIERLGYSPNVAARNLASAGALRIGVMYGNPSASYTSELLVSLLANSGRIGCQLILEKGASQRNALAAADRLIAAEVSGVILQTPLCDSAKLLQYFERAGVPTLAAGTGREDADGLSIWIDNRSAAREMTRYLVSLGHRAIGFIRGHPGMIDCVQRYQGFEDALTEAGLAVDPALVKQGQYTFRSGLVAAEELLVAEPRPTAIFASNDEMAAGALAAAHKCRLEVPRDLSIAGFDDAPLATTLWPSLTTIRQPIDGLTELALGMLATEIRRRRAGAAPARVRKMVRLRLIKRDSAAPPPG